MVDLRDNIPDGPVGVPDLVRRWALGPLEPVWRNELGGLTFRDGDRYIKWSTQGDLGDEEGRLRWAARYTPMPEVIQFETDLQGQILITRALPGAGAVTDRWRAQPAVAVRAIAEGLRSMHETLPAGVCEWIWREAEGDEADQVVCHGDPCAPNTIIRDDGRWSGHVDMGSMGTANRWADLAVCSMSLDWNFGEGWQPLFFEAYGIERDEDRIRHYRALWNDEP